MRTLNPKQITDLIAGPAKSPTPTTTSSSAQESEGESTASSQATSLRSDWGIKKLLVELLTTLIEIEPGCSVDLYVELIHLVIMLCATQIYDTQAVHRTLSFGIETQELAGLASALVTKLLRNAVLDLVELRYQSIGFLGYFLGLPKDVGHEVSDMSLYLLLLLANQGWRQTSNPFREALQTLANSEVELPLTLSRPPCAPFAQVYEVLSRSVNTPQGAILLYILFLENPAFKEFLMNMPDPQKLLLGILQFLYESLTIPIVSGTAKKLVAEPPTLTSKLSDCHIYLLLIVLLVFSGNIGFNQRAHTIVS